MTLVINSIRHHIQACNGDVVEGGRPSSGERRKSNPRERRPSSRERNEASQLDTVNFVGDITR